MQISKQAQHLVNLEVQISWQAQHFVNLEVQISWQAQSLVDFEAQVLWQVLFFADRGDSWQAKHFVSKSALSRALLNMCSHMCSCVRSHARGFTRHPRQANQIYS